MIDAVFVAWVIWVDLDLVCAFLVGGMVGLMWLFP